MRLRIVSLALLVIGMSQAQQSKQDFTLIPQTAKSGWTVTAAMSSPIVICDADPDGNPHNCKLQDGHTLDEAMQAWVKSLKDKDDAWKEVNADTEKRLCVAIDMLKAITHNKTKTPGCEK